MRAAIPLYLGFCLALFGMSVVTGKANAQTQPPGSVPPMGQSAGQTLATPVLTQTGPAAFDPADFGKIVIMPRQSTNGSGLTLEQAFGAYKNEPIVKYGVDSPAVRLGRPIGRLDILFEDGRTGFCTAFLVDDQHILTNHHCVPGMDAPADGSGVSAAQFVAGYIAPGRSEGVDRYTVSPEIVETSRALDYTVLRVFGDPASRYGTLALTAETPEDAEFLWVIGHPKGQVMHISREGCAAASPAISGEGKLMHSCDTLGGNSGSPVIRLSDKRVVGLHHAGDSLSGLNMAIPMARILANSQVLTGTGQAASPAIAPDPAPRPAASAPQGDACRALWLEAKPHGCAGYEAYLSACGTDVFAGLARRYLTRACAAPSSGAEAGPEPVSRPDNGTALTVDPLGAGDFTSLAAAIGAAYPGAQIDVFPGIYTAPLVVDKPLNLRGQGAVADIVIRVRDATALRWTAASGRISGLTVIQDGSRVPSKGFHAVEIASGSVTLDNSVLTSRSGVALAVHTADSAILRDNQIRDSQTGVLVTTGALALFEGNTLSGNARAGFEVRNGGRPTVRGNILRDGGGAGILVTTGGGGLFEDNTFHDNTLSAVQVQAARDVVIRNNVLRHGRKGGILVSDGATARIEGNRIWGNALSGLEIKTGAAPEVLGNQIHDGAQSGVYIHSGGAGVLQDNEIHSNAFYGISVKGDSAPIVRGNVIRDNAYEAIRLRAGAGGVYENNDLSGNRAGAFRVEPDAGEVLRRGNSE